MIIMMIKVIIMAMIITMLIMIMIITNLIMIKRMIFVVISIAALRRRQIGREAAEGEEEKKRKK